MSRCEQEMCPNWDGDGCPCEVFGFEPGEPAPSGTYTVIVDPAESRGGSDVG